MTKSLVSKTPTLEHGQSATEARCVNKVHQISISGLFGWLCDSCVQNYAGSGTKTWQLLKVLLRLTRDLFALFV